MTEIAEQESLNPGSSRSTFYVIAAILLIMGGGIFYVTKSPATMVETPTPSAESMIAAESPMAKQAAGEMRTINMLGSKFKFDPATITVKKGETIKIVLASDDMPHDFVVDELNIQSDKIMKGESTTFEITPDKVGEFEYYCSVGNHRAMGMVGKLIVTE